MVSKNREIPPGTSDFRGLEMIQREHVLDTIRNTYIQFGFDPLHTPVLENAQVFDGHHGEGERLIFHLDDNWNNSLVLRYDLTVPLARVVNMYSDLPMPFKRYQIGTVFRDDSVDKWHFREFTQCDGDVIWNGSLTADADIIMLAHAWLSNLKFKDFVIRINHRQIIRALAELSWVDSKEWALAVQRALDYADKVIKNGVDWIRQDLQTRWIDPKIIDNIIELIQIKWDHDELLKRLEIMFSWNQTWQKWVQEIKEIISYLPRDVLNKVSIDFTLARWADYYTGFILEWVVPWIPVWAVLWGWRYDNLVSAFWWKPQPAVGMAFGFERIYTAMNELNMFQSVVNGNSMRVLVTSSWDVSRNKAFLVAQSLRSNGVWTDFIDTDTAFFWKPDLLQKYVKKRVFWAIIHLDDSDIDNARLNLTEHGGEALQSRIFEILAPGNNT